MRVGQRELLRYIMAKDCPCCEGLKLDGCMFCDSCWKKLPENLKSKIHNAMRSLSEALRAGLELLV